MTDGNPPFSKEDAEIADVFVVSVRTVESHRAQTQRTLDLSKHSQLVRHAFDRARAAVGAPSDRRRPLNACIQQVPWERGEAQAEDGRRLRTSAPTTRGEQRMSRRAATWDRAGSHERRRYMADGADMTLLHVVPDARGNWRVVEEGRSATLSEHASVTEAELMSWSRCRSLDTCVVVVHDRYGRTRPASAWTKPTARGSASPRQ